MPSLSSNPHTMTIKMTRRMPTLLWLLWLMAVATHAATTPVFQAALRIPLPSGPVDHALQLHGDQEPVDVLEHVRRQYALTHEWRQHTLQQVCAHHPRVVCRREAAQVFTTHIHDASGASLGILELLEHHEPADIVTQFAARHGMTRAQRQHLLHTICQSPNVSCTRLRTLLFQQEIHSDGAERAVGTLEIYDNEEPVDVIYRFLKDHALPISVLPQLMIAACQQQQISCERETPLVFNRVIQTGAQGGDSLGRLQIPLGVEPVDAVQAFAARHSLDKASRQSLLRSVCSDGYVKCVRHAPYVFASPIALENGTRVGELRVQEDEELADAVYRFARRVNITEELRIALLRQLCGQGGIRCTRGQALLRSLPVRDGTGAVLGELRVFEGQEPADAVYAFAQEHQLSAADAVELVDTLCGLSRQSLSQRVANNDDDGDDEEDIPLDCTRFAPLQFAVPVAAKNGSRLGVLEVLLGDEPADAVARFGNKHGLSQEEKHNLLVAVCDARGLECTRQVGIMYQTSYTLPNGIVERLDFYDGQEPADLVYAYAQMRNLTFQQRKAFLVEVCNEPRRRPNCTRAEPMLLSIPVWETAEKKLGDLEILEGQEPVDMVYAFLEKHDLFQTEPLNTTLLPTVCNSTRVVCARQRPRRILFSMQATYHGIMHTLQYVQPESDWICEQHHRGQKCVHYAELLSREFCATHMSDWIGCEVRILEAVRFQLEAYETGMWRGKDLYAKMGLVKSASREEIDSAYNRLVKRFNNETEPQKYEKLREAYRTLSDPEEKYFYDLPCLKFFGLCGKKKKDGSISISAD